MFIVLELEQENEKKGMIAYLRGILTKPKASLEEVQIPGASYWRISSPQHQGAPLWEEIEELAGRKAGHMLLPEGIEPPEQSAIAQPECPAFEKRVLLHTACALIDRTRMPMYRRVLGIIDPQGEHAEMLPKLLMHYTSVRVLTGNQREYERAAERMMEELGAPVLVGDAPSLLQDCVMILAPAPAAVPEDTRFGCPVMAGASFRPPRGCDVFTAPQVRPPAGVDVPPGISAHRFAAALYEFCNMEMESYTARRILYNYRSCNLGEAAQIILQNSSAALPV